MLLPGIYLTNKICLNYSETPAMLSLRKQLGWIMNPVNMLYKEMSEFFSGETIDSHSQIISVAFEFLPVYSWTCGVGATRILLISWCLNFLLSCLWCSLGQPLKSVTCLPSVCFKSSGSQLKSIEDPLHEFTKEILGPNWEILYPLPPLPIPIHRLDFHHYVGAWTYWENALKAWNGLSVSVWASLYL